MARSASLSLALPTRPSVRPWRLHQKLQPWLLPAALLLLWQLASRFAWMSEQVLPSPSLVWQTALDMAFER